MDVPTLTGIFCIREPKIDNLVAEAFVRQEQSINRSKEGLLPNAFLSF
jgi:hypothetical protein